MVRFIIFENLNLSFFLAFRQIIIHVANKAMFLIIRLNLPNKILCLNRQLFMNQTTSGTSHNYLPIKMVSFFVILRYSSVRERRLSFFFMPCLTKKQPHLNRHLIMGCTTRIFCILCQCEKKQATYIIMQVAYFLICQKGINFVLNESNLLVISPKYLIIFH